MKTIPRALRVIALAGAGVTCSIPRIHYYTLEVPHVSSQAAPENSYHVTIQRFSADQILRDERILYREGPHEVSFYEYHRWASPPAELVTSYFIHRLRDSGTYARVSSYKDGPQADFILQGRLHNFEEVDRGKETLASVALEIELLEAKTRQPIWRNEADCTRPLPGRDMAGLVDGIYGCLDETATKLLTAMHEQIRQRGK